MYHTMITHNIHTGTQSLIEFCILQLIDTYKTDAALFRIQNFWLFHLLDTHSFSRTHENSTNLINNLHL